MARGNGWRSGVLILLLALAAVPAGAVEGRGARGTVGAGWGWIGEVWRAVVERIVPVEWRAKLGPGMDPDGLTVKLGPDMDPDGLTARPGSQGTQTAPAGGDLGPEMDPNGRH